MSGPEKKPLDRIVDIRAPEDEIDDAAKEAGAARSTTDGVLPAGTLSDGSPVGMRGRLVMQLSPEQQKHLMLVAQRPCGFCKNGKEPKGDFQWADLRKFMRKAVRDGIMAADTTPAIFRRCVQTRMWVPVTRHTCEAWECRDAAEYYAYIKTVNEMLRDAVSSEKAAKA